jgi:cell division protein FtsB
MFKRKSFLVLNLGVLLLIGWGFAGEYVRNKQLESEIETLERRSEELAARNLELADLADRLAGPEMVEKEARLKLNLQKPGEEVVVIRGSGPVVTNGSASPGTDADAEEGTGIAMSNPRKWLHHFFNRQN